MQIDDGPHTPNPDEGDDGKDELFSIGDLAHEFEITTRAIRFYESKGLISPRRVGHARTYTGRDRARLTLILRAKRLGYALDDILEFLDLYDADRTPTAQLNNACGKIDTSISELERKRADIDSSVYELKRIRAAFVERIRDNKSKQG